MPYACCCVAGVLSFVYGSCWIWIFILCSLCLRSLYINMLSQYKGQRRHALHITHRQQQQQQHKKNPTVEPEPEVAICVGVGGWNVGAKPVRM